MGSFTEVNLVRQFQEAFLQSNSLNDKINLVIYELTKLGPPK